MTKKAKKILLVEDDRRVMEGIRQMLTPYQEDDAIEILIAHDAGEAMGFLSSGDIGAIVLDVMLPYGEAADTLDARSDPEELETGLRILRELRKKEAESQARPTWVAAITSRNNQVFLKELKRVLDGNGKLYLKPFNDIDLEDDLANELSIASRADPILLSPRRGR